MNEGETKKTVAVMGATGFIGRRLVPELLKRGHEVRCLVRNPADARAKLPAQAELIEADAEKPETLAPALKGVEHAFFLVHLMGQGSDYGERERRSAEDFAVAAKQAGVDRISYLGGLGGNSPHLRSRAATAEVLAENGPPLTYFRAGMVVGPGSEAYELLNAILSKLPVIPAPPFLDNRTQPIGSRDLVRYLAFSPEIEEARGREIQVGSTPARSHREVISTLARELGRSIPPYLGVSGRLAPADVMAAGAAMVTSGDAEVASELSQGLLEDTIVTDRSGAELFPIVPESLEVSIHRALAEKEREDG